MSVESQPSISAMHPLLLIGVQFWVKDVLLGGWRDSKSLKFASRHEVRRNILCSRFHYPRSRGDIGLGSLASFLVDIHHRPAFVYFSLLTKFISVVSGSSLTVVWNVVLFTSFYALCWCQFFPALIFVIVPPFCFCPSRFSFIGFWFSFILCRCPCGWPSNSNGFRDNDVIYDLTARRHNVLMPFGHYLLRTRLIAGFKEEFQIFNRQYMDSS